MTTAERIEAFVTAYDRGWHDCAESLQFIPAAERDEVLARIITKTEEGT